MSSYNFNYYGWRELLVCCLVCGDKICNRGYWCEVCACSDCRWYEYIPEVKRGCCFYPLRVKNPQFDAILEELGLTKKDEGSKDRNKRKR